MKPSILLLLGLLGLSQTIDIADGVAIFNGTTCIPNSQPWQVGLFEGNQLLCGGVLISPHWVLTTAHCNHKKYWVRLGDHSLQNVDWTEQIRRTGRSVTHPGFRAQLGSFNHDLRLLYLPLPARVTRAVQPLALPTACVTPGTLCQVSGWGITNSHKHPDKLQCLSLRITQDNKCQTVFPGMITENMVCAGGDTGRDACQGDSGGPLVCDNVLQGLVSWGAVGPCNQSGIPGVYTKICKYTDWLRETMRKK
ncbi:kallikrein-12-like isoform X1 [Petaurus breviceps papuanus]|uniref:kallikrein-12-like isoform X1 n=1 Tax=Petaurus breviceps papuanus TaxID=3040969 RepID=UPI0036D8F06F